MTDECVLFFGCRDAYGYGAKTYKGKLWKAHRLAWTLENGAIPPGLSVLHKCDNPPCIRIDHLWLGTKGDNNRDMWAKGRAVTWNSFKTECPRGHPYDEANTRIYKGSRHCRACTSRAGRLLYQREDAQ